MSWDLGIQPITKRFLRPNYLLALAFREGFVFGRVLLAEKLQYRPLKMVDAGGTVIDIAIATGQAEVRFRDPRNVANDILYLDTAYDPEGGGLPWILHGSLGIHPPMLQFYVRYPEGSKPLGKWPNADPARPGSGDFFSYVDGYNSPYEEPTDYQELWIAPKVHISAEIFNPDDVKAHQPVPHLLFSLYHFQALLPGNDAQRRLIRLIATRQVPATFGQCGPTRSLINYAYTSDWNVKPMTLEEASRE